jgi:hypothetical protein
MSGIMTYLRFPGQLNSDLQNLQSTWARAVLSIGVFELIGITVPCWNNESTEQNRAPERPSVTYPRAHKVDTVSSIHTVIHLDSIMHA